MIKTDLLIHGPAAFRATRWSREGTEGLTIIGRADSPVGGDTTLCFFGDGIESARDLANAILAELDRWAVEKV